MTKLEAIRIARDMADEEDVKMISAEACRDKREAQRRAVRGEAIRTLLRVSDDGTGRSN